ncbi:protein tyrosine phosphatase [Thermodesulfobium narugense DSM 14796]|uniref:Protein tyrosine phosphatase n=1 Tax=Thermodesulfobium narugense DSM 14796 TaxID=747365 RepID=M1E792_9BACT|nr:arsenate reductase ArsC [Thermodesulfobium narugense]AEE14548.1 protein tyrosine phosphatase [Thermodesulfobium narugense DSM 14796]
MRKKVLFLCTHNSARSQMAQGLMNVMLSENYEAFSAGTFATSINPYAIKVMNEIGIDISNQYSKNFDMYLNDEFDYIVTVCDNAKEGCPYFAGGKKQLHKGFEDPASFSGTYEEKLVKFREVRDKIKEWILEYFK